MTWRFVVVDRARAVRPEQMYWRLLVMDARRTWTEHYDANGDVSLTFTWRRRPQELCLPPQALISARR